jgi:hypothetical protein
MFRERTFEQTLIVENYDPNGPLNVIFEPWGDQMHLSPNGSVRLVAESPVAGAFHVLAEPGRLIVTAWARCTLRIFDVKSGQELRSVSANIPSP